MKNKYKIIKSGGNKGRIRALRSFGDVKKGDIGGFIESETNLSHNGDCWVYDDARVHGKSEVTDNARVTDNAWVCGDSRVTHNTEISGNAFLFNKALVTLSEEVTGNVEIPIEIIDFMKWTLSESEYRGILVGKVR